MRTKTEKLANALLDLTKKDKIHWTIEHTETWRLFDGVEIDGHLYKSVVNGKRVYLCRISFAYTDEYDQGHRDYSYRLTVTGNNGEPETEMDSKYLFESLYEEVRDRCHDVNDWAEEVFKMALA